jgi:hypothetical protein
LQRSALSDLDRPVIATWPDVIARRSPNPVPLESPRAGLKPEPPDLLQMLIGIIQDVVAGFF